MTFYFYGRALTVIFFFDKVLVSPRLIYDFLISSGNKNIICGLYRMKTNNDSTMAFKSLDSYFSPYTVQMRTYLP